MFFLYLFVLYILFYYFLNNKSETFINYPESLTNNEEEKYYNCNNNNILNSYRIDSYNSYNKNKDMYDLNTKLLVDEDCITNGIPTTF